ncbi:MAG: CCA tRNA nucleotidyltransferase [Candidatus Aenigmarchaeota archaeon]|nr:CCA tRNA nucleotidyltransferase [Candidatus Aenigmarchaeota archaeon]
MELYAEILKKIKPSHEEVERVKRFVQQLLSVSKTISGLDGVIVGSIGKFTWLAGDHDIDLFILFDSSVPREELERLGLEYGRRIVEELGGRWQIKYAEHPYTSAKIRGFDVDIVPCYRIRYGEKIKSAVDRSPLHLQHVLDYIKPAMVDHVRLLKQFCKGIGVYGSDAKNQGFSGYICELLVLNYGSFGKVLEAASAWKPPHIINTERHLGVPVSQFRDQPLVIIDPVDPNRNVAAVVSGENFVKFVSACRRFTAKPSSAFFFPAPAKPLSSQQIASLQRRETKFIAIQIKRPVLIDDVLYPQLRRMISRIVSLLEHHEFHVLRSFEFAEGDPVLLFELEVWSLPAVKKMTGPPIFTEKHTAEFLTKYAKNFVYIDDNKWIAEVQRKHKTAVSLLSSFLKGKPPELVEKGIPKYIASSRVKLIEHHELWKLVKKDKKLSDCMRKKYFESLE